MSQTIEITDDVLDAMNTGAHDFATVKAARKVLEAAGYIPRNDTFRIVKGTRS